MDLNLHFVGQCRECERDSAGCRVVSGPALVLPVPTSDRQKKILISWYNGDDRCCFIYYINILRGMGR